MHYYIDGYNLLFRILPVKENLQLVREAFVYDFSYKVAALNLDVTLVFDSHYQEGESTKSHIGNLEIIYTAKGESADDFIIKSIKRCQNPKNQTVVTSDNKLAWRVRRHLAKTETVEVFNVMVEKRLKSRHARQEERLRESDKPKEIRRSEPEKITIPESHIPPEESFDYYRQIFEEKYETLAPAVVENVIQSPSYSLAFEEDEDEVEAVDLSLNEEERWLKIFEQRSKKLEEGQGW